VRAVVIQSRKLRGVLVEIETQSQVDDVVDQELSVISILRRHKFSQKSKIGWLLGPLKQSPTFDAFDVGN